MGNWTRAEYQMHMARLKSAAKAQETVGEAPAREVGKGGLHEQIIRWCDNQWPKWKYIHARCDRKSTIDLGAPDFVIFCPNGRLLVIECKMPGKKRTPEQLAWALQLEMLGHACELVTTMEEFLALTVKARM